MRAEGFGCSIELNGDQVVVCKGLLSRKTTAFAISDVEAVKITRATAMDLGLLKIYTAARPSGGIRSLINRDGFTLTFRWRQQRNSKTFIRP